MGKFIARLIAAIRAALQGSWKVVDGVLTWVRDAVCVGDEPVAVDESTCRSEPVSEPQLEVGIKEWAAKRMTGDLPRLPAGISPAQARWATSLKGEELSKVARSSPTAIRAHLAGEVMMAGVRPVVASTQVEDEQATRLAALRARGAAITAALARTRDAYEARCARSAAIY